jgi:predicted phage terminase large subunit-like protein
MEQWKLPWWFDLSMEDTLRFYRQVHACAIDDLHDKRNRRDLALNDLFYLMVECLDRVDMVQPWIFERCREVQRNPNGCLDLWAREHYKSTIITLGHTILDILRNPDITACIFSHNRPTAKKFLRDIMQQFERNQTLKYLFDDILWENPRSAAPKWSEDDGIVLKRKNVQREPTLMASGLVDGMPTGSHFKLRVYDDVVTEKSVTTPDMIKKTTEAWELSDNLGSKGGVERYIGTRYHLHDTYRTMMRRNVVQVRQHTATLDGTDDCSKSVLLPPDTLAAKRKKQGAYTFSCQMLQNPLADNVMGFKEEDLRYWGVDSLKGLNFIILVDPSGGQTNKSDFTSMWLIGLGGDRNFYVIELIRDRLNLVQKWEQLYRMHRRCREANPNADVFVGYEKIGHQSDIAAFEEKQKQLNYRFKIHPLGGIKKKENRIRRLAPLFESHRIWLPKDHIIVNSRGESEDMIRSFIEDEYTVFPVTDHDDALDSLSRLEDEYVKPKLKWPSYVDPEENIKREIARQQRADRPVV